MATRAPSAGEISGLLAGRMPELVADLLPGARREGRLARIGSPDGEPGQSCAIHLVGARAGRWHDFASGQDGDALDLIRAVRRCDTREAIAWAHGWLGTGADIRPPREPAAPRRVPPSDDAEARRRLALKLWLAARGSLAGTPAEAYLAARGIDLADLARAPRALRFHPGLWCPEAGARLPALVAAVIRGGEFCGIHRTYLQETRPGVWTKARLASPKRSLGSLAGGVVPLQRGASGKPLRAAPDGDAAVIGEGLETCLSIAIACPELRVLCAVSLGNLCAVALPAAITRIIIAADNDVAPGAQKLLRCAAQTFIEQGREVRIARSPVGKDFNDCLQESKSP
ncbi:MAG: DUF7146 domain-containing protein [Acidibrevibacterium sp.]|uniref:DUF7146 domain-containing protein n=1 Tax=Acidibrevibacterium sp. TaxID=2606776 RepID=UPI003D01B895